mmetsp:Transcript_13104/g.37860  ORF Transcript_13104/g.37860 Transcript_13104/m.37860 type:complete len:222 (+) Transcript_13104:80-745(+)|eukprot:CAMPEP_0119554110 /NCGR_PEP_ID=MMETSP1352-20130426/6683_1 /TAXON_ID=265584 /ORGANISM="Stauroneis constricta, Strain CCMP1120" /LENGTH=221 /DNA_ID=CAMNT_0007600637 /DNA_START=66 /DNA_END=731 /DNA_ORIENTATION=-
MVRWTLIAFLAVLATVMADDDDYVTCGSVVKLTHVESGVKTKNQYFLNSETKNLGTGSGQQIVTANADPTSTDTLWWIRAANDERPDHKSACKEGPAEHIACGSAIRLTHLNTMRNLHSHGVSSPLSRQQEVTAYGAGDGKGDGGDDWLLVCDTIYWKREQQVQFQHIDTGKFLGASSTVKFTQQNCGHQCPIMNHLEVFGRSQKDSYGMFMVEMGAHLSK